MRQRLVRGWWAAAFAAALAVPLWLSIGVGGHENVLLRLAVEFGLLGTSALAATVVLPARMRSLTRALGIEKVLGGHRYLGMMTVTLVLAHVVFVVVGNPANLARLDLLHAPPAGRAATLATGAMVLIVALTVLRRRLRTGYEWWRRVHRGLAAAALVLTALHVWWLNHMIRDAAMRAWFVGLATAVLLCAAYRWVLRPLLHGRAEFVVLGIRPESPTVSTLVLEPRRARHSWGYRPVAYAPGQFAWIRLRRWALFPEEHPFTIASAARPGRVEFTVSHIGAFTTALRELEPGRSVWLDGPHGTFSVDHLRTSGLVLVAGGVGITPMMSMLRTLADRGDRRPHRLIVAARHVEDLLFRDELAAIAARIPLTVTEVLSRPPEGWQGATGRITPQLLDALLPGAFRRNQLDYFICGSTAMVEGTREAITALDVPAHRIHTEQFQMV